MGELSSEGRRGGRAVAGKSYRRCKPLKELLLMQYTQPHALVTPVKRWKQQSVAYTYNGILPFSLKRNEILYVPHE